MAEEVEGEDRGTGTNPQRERIPRSLWVLLGLSFVIKAILILPAGPPTLHGDAQWYLRGALSIAAQGVPDYGVPLWDEAHWSPVYPYLLGGIYRLLDQEGFLPTLRLLQIALSTGTAWLVFVIARRAFDRRTALVAAGVTAFFPTLAAYAQYPLSETVFTALFVAVCAVLTPADTPATPRRALAAGLLGGAAALTRSAFLAPSLLIVLWILACLRAPFRRRALTAAAFVAGLVIVVAPWSVRNTLRYERFLLVDTNAGNVLYKNWNAIRPENHDPGLKGRYQEDRAAAVQRGVRVRPRIERENFVDRYDAEVRAALRYVVAHPTLFLEHCVLRAAELVNPTSYLVRDLREGDYGELPRALEELGVLLTLASTMAVLALGALGLVLRPLGESRSLPACMVLGVVGMGILVIAMSRYRFPMMPLLIPFAVHTALGWRSLPRPSSARLRWAAAAVLMTLLAWAWVLYVPYSYGRVFTVE